MIKVNMYRMCTRVCTLCNSLCTYVCNYSRSAKSKSKNSTLVFTVHNESMYCMIPAAAAGTDSTVCMVQACFFASFTIIINDQ